MTLRKAFFEYLDQFGQTVSVDEFRRHPETPNLICLRHDVDHSLDMAMEMAYWEHRRGFRATYYLLPDAGYWADPRLIDKCLQIQDFGHEIGLHVNTMTEWFKGSIADPYERLAQILKPMRAAGLAVNGAAAHGDRLCYTRQYINYWLFRELRPQDPERRETGLSAEGIPATDDQSRIRYPRDHVLRRDDGVELPLWSVSMQELGLEYHAVHVPFERYFTDSGGDWIRSSDPRKENLAQGRHQILMHPEYWKGRQRLFFFLSTARSGSKWLATVLDNASSLVGRHEFMLNHRWLKGELVADKRTADGFTELQKHPSQAADLLREIRLWVEDLDRDYAEINVYLERFIDNVADIFPEATLIHLHRQPSDVVRSILNRNWYDTPDDDRHPYFDIEGWRKYSQLERACLYVRYVNENLLTKCKERLSYERMVADPQELARLLENLQVAFYPRLANPLFSQIINASTVRDFPEYSQWSPQKRDAYHTICDSINRELGYPCRDMDCSMETAKSEYAHFDQVKFRDSETMGKRLASYFSRLLKNTKGDRSASQKGMDPIVIDFAKGSPSHRTRAEIIESKLTIFPKPGRNSYFLFGGGTWKSINSKSGWKAAMAHYYRGVLKAELTEDKAGNASLFCVMYDKSGKYIAHRSLVRLRNDKNQYEFSFRLRGDTAKFNLALYMPKNQLPEKVLINSLTLEVLPVGSEI